MFIWGRPVVMQEAGSAGDSGGSGNIGGDTGGGGEGSAGTGDPSISIAPGAGGGDGGTGGDGPAAWSTLRSGLPAEIRDHASLNAYEETGLAGLTKDYLNLQSQFGKGGARAELPKEEWGDTEYADFYGKTGRPEKSSEYDLGDFERPEGLEWADGRQDEVMALFHKAGISQRQANELVRGYTELEVGDRNGVVESDEMQYKEAVADLRAEYGLAFDAKIELGKRVFAQAGEDALNWRIDGVNADTHPGFINFLVKMGEMVGEEAFPGAIGSASGAMSPAQAQEKLAEFERDPENQQILSDTSDHRYEGTKKRWDALSGMAYPG